MVSLRKKFMTEGEEMEAENASERASVRAETEVIIRLKGGMIKVVQKNVEEKMSYGKKGSRPSDRHGLRSE